MRYQRIEETIKSNLKHIQTLEMEDQSHLHAGRAGQESHFKVLVVSEDFEGESRVQRQRKIQQLLAPEFEQGLHALSLRLLTPTEFDKQKQPYETPDCQGSNRNQ